MELEQDREIERGWAGPGIEIWKDEDTEWIMRHRNVKRGLECEIPKVAASPFCGQGYHTR